MTSLRAKAIQRHKYTVKLVSRWFPRPQVRTFATDLAAVRFMEHAMRLGATIISCEAPHA